MKFPYAISNFYKLIENNYFYADRTDAITHLEQAADQILFLRPRRFGKSLLLSMLENYYDVLHKDDFQKLFGHLHIGKNPTPSHNQYLILHWDFSVVDPNGSSQEIHDALHRYINACIRVMKNRYADLLPDFPLDDDAVISFYNLVAASQQTPHKLYLFIDEYDNFANEVMTQGKKRYTELVYGEGLLKTLFKSIKTAATGQGLDRVFITGVSPVVMSDMTSGYNVSENISLLAEYQDLCGFRETEIQSLLEKIGQEWDFSVEKVQETLMMMRTFYNGYRFGNENQQKIYNPTLALYFLKYLSHYGKYPPTILDDNLAMDRNRIQYIARLPHGQEVITNALNPDNPIIIAELANRFGVEDMLHIPRDHSFLASLLYYFGVLTLGEEKTALGKSTLQIPNLVIRRLYVERLKDALLPEYKEREQMEQAAEVFYGTANLDPLCDFIEQRYFKVFDNRDYRWSNELVVKTAFLVTLFADTFYIMDSETAIDKAYADLSLIVRPDMRQYALLDHLLEFKYISLKDLGLSGEQVREQSREELLALPLVKKQLADAGEQLGRYRETLERVYGEKLRLHTRAVVALGLERLVWA
ncbi:AAA family ATPase [Candidatus Venteria ishoeyi]|uniref:Putative AAA-ATPase n=1 Tax=Candidatus Venteria ishoeyi TaxID=1899563 RepID=A0A1H6F6P4_9GAMM|nr:AAA family ATPase [Candidatus Venteria ishoeyi]SEH05071.1 putative AAA-ATPase [Candidatus Venteria ishoeyi]